MCPQGNRQCSHKSRNLSLIYMLCGQLQLVLLQVAEIIGVCPNVTEEEAAKALDLSNGR